MHIIRKLEIWGKVQREYRRRKSDWGINLGGWNSPRNKITWPELQPISIRRTRIVDLG